MLQNYTKLIKPQNFSSVFCDNWAKIRKTPTGEVGVPEVIDVVKFNELRIICGL